MESEERMTVETVNICTCGIVMHQLNPDDYDSGGSDSGTCCPDCGNEKFQTVKQLQAKLDSINKALEPVKDWYGGGTEGNRTNAEILTDAIYDLQKDRKEVLKLKAELDGMSKMILGYKDEILTYQKDCFANSKINEKLQAELDQLSVESLDIQQATERKLSKQIDDLQAEIDTRRWIPVEGIELKLEKADWRLFTDMTKKNPAPEMRYVSKISVLQIIRANNFTHWMPIILPEQALEGGE